MSVVKAPNWLAVSDAIWTVVRTPSCSEVMDPICAVLKAATCEDVRATSLSVFRVDNAVVVKPGRALMLRDAISSVVKLLSSSASSVAT